MEIVIFWKRKFLLELKWEDTKKSGIKCKFLMDMKSLMSSIGSKPSKLAQINP